MAAEAGMVLEADKVFVEDKDAAEGMADLRPDARVDFDETYLA